MNIGAAPADFPSVIGLLLASLAGIAVIFLVVFILARALSRLLHVAPGWIAAALNIAVFGGVLLALSLYLAGPAETLRGTVVQKTTRTTLRRQGDWLFAFRTTVSYPHNGATGSADLRLNAAQFDRLQEGATAELKLLPLFRTVALVNLAGPNAMDWLTPVLWWGALGVSALAAVRLLARSEIGCFVLIGVGLLLATAVPAVRTWRAWQAAEALAARPLRTTAVVTAVDRITELDYVPCYRNCTRRKLDTAFTARQPYDIVQLTYTPDGYTEAVTAVDSADAGSFSGRVGESIPIAYAADNPRDAQLIGATHSHHWRNAVWFVIIYAVAPALVLGGVAALVLAQRRKRRRLSASA